jgi:hypothetical protein
MTQQSQKEERLADRWYTVIVESTSGKVVHEYADKLNFRVALEQFASENGVTEPHIRRTHFGYRMTSEQGDWRATYRRD